MEKFKEINTENFEKFSLEENYENWLPDKVRTSLVAKSSLHKFSLEESLIDCKSPIEQLLAIELEDLKLTNTLKYNPFVDVVDVKKQEKIKVKDKKYIVDFLIPVWYKNQGAKIFIVECDGYEFHQKTKKQVENDNIRQRNLQEAGYEIIRFSGTEIYHKAHQCALQIKNIILSKCEYIKDE